jgi:hypothetical protein
MAKAIVACCWSMFPRASATGVSAPGNSTAAAEADASPAAALLAATLLEAGAPEVELVPASGEPDLPPPQAVSNRVPASAPVASRRWEEVEFSMMIPTPEIE